MTRPVAVLCRESKPARASSDHRVGAGLVEWTRESVLLSYFYMLYYSAEALRRERDGQTGTGPRIGTGTGTGTAFSLCIWDANTSFSPWLVRFSASAALLGVLCNIPGCIISLAEMSTVEGVDDSVNVGSTLQRVPPGIGILSSVSKTLKIRDGRCFPK